MLRYYALASVIVLGAVALAGAFVHPGRKLQVASVESRGTPSRGRAAGEGGPPPGVGGDAPWALSALPECFRQASEARGSAAFVGARLPAGSRPLVRGARVESADCSVTVERDGAAVERGTLRLRIPPEARLFQTAGGREIVVLRELAGRADLRVYRGADGARLSVSAPGGTDAR